MNSTIEKMALSDSTILLTGNTGTGKSHLAKEIHLKSARRERRFSAINLATLSENLIESELFGHERGAFSGAENKRIGKMEISNGGTVFLDEIGELSLRLQTKLLEVLNSKTLSPVGSNRDLTLNVRFIVATNRNLREMVEARLFREDLYFRINSFSVVLPSLVEDPARIYDLAHLFLVEARLQQNKPNLPATQSFLDQLLEYDWPGNIRELKNAMEFATAIAPENQIDSGCLPPYIRESITKKTQENPLVSILNSTTSLDYQTAKNQFERNYLIQALKVYKGRINMTARSTGISKVTLIEKIKKYQINVEEIKYQNYQEGKTNSCIALA